MRGGVRLYIDGNILLKKAKAKLKRALSEVEDAMDMKQNGLRRIKSEYKFINGEEPVQPNIDADYVCTKLIMGIIESLEDEELENLGWKEKKGCNNGEGNR